MGSQYKEPNSSNHRVLGAQEDSSTIERVDETAGTLQQRGGTKVRAGETFQGTEQTAYTINKLKIQEKWAAALFLRSNIIKN